MARHGAKLTAAVVRTVKEAACTATNTDCFCGLSRQDTSSGSNARHPRQAPRTRFGLLSARYTGRSRRPHWPTGACPGGAAIRWRPRARGYRRLRKPPPRWIEIHRPNWKNAKHTAQWTATLRQYVFPRIGRSGLISSARPTSWPCCCRSGTTNKRPPGECGNGSER